MASAQFEIDPGTGVFAPPGEPVDVSASGAVVICRVVDIAGIVPPYVWNCFGTNDSSVVPITPTLAGEPIGQLAIFNIPPGAGQSYGISLRVNGGPETTGDTATEARSAIFVRSTTDFRLFIAGETFEENKTHGPVERLNELLNALNVLDAAPSDSEYILGSSDIDLPNSRVLDDSTTISWDYSVAGVIESNIIENSISNLLLRDSQALSVIGRASNSIGDPSDIVASLDGHVLRRSGTSLDFGTIGPSSLTGINWAYVLSQGVNSGNNSPIVDDGQYLGFGGGTLPTTGTIRFPNTINSTIVGLASDGTDAIVLMWNPSNNSVRIGDQADVDSVFAIGSTLFSIFGFNTGVEIRPNGIVAIGRTTGGIVNSTTVDIDATGNVSILNDGNVIINPGGDVVVKNFTGILQGTAGVISVASGILLNDGDKGDITVSASGLTWIIDNDVVTFSKFQNISTDVLLGRDTAGSGDVEEISLAGGLEFTGTSAIRRSALTGAISAGVGSNTTLFSGIRDNGSVENDRTNLNFINGNNTVISVTDDAAGDELEISVSVDNLPISALADIADDTFLANISGGAAPPAAIGLTTLAGDGLVYDATSHELDITGSSSITVTGDQVQRSALSGAIVANLNSNATVFAGILDNGASENNRTNLNFVNGTNTTANVTDDSGNDELEISFNVDDLPISALADIADDTFLANVSGLAGPPTAVSLITLAGDGIQGGANAILNIDVSDFAGTGLEDDGSENLRIASTAAGAGLTGGSGVALAVGSGDGIDVAADTVSVDVTDIVDNVSIIEVATNNIQRAALTGDVTAAAGSNITSITNNAVTNAHIRDSAALSVIGNSTNAVSDPADIVANTDGHVLRRSGTTLGFGTLGTNSLTGINWAYVLSEGSNSGPNNPIIDAGQYLGFGGGTLPGSGQLRLPAGVQWNIIGRSTTAATANVFRWDGTDDSILIGEAADIASIQVACAGTFLIASPTLTDVRGTDVAIRPSAGVHIGRTSGGTVISTLVRIDASGDVEVLNDGNFQVFSGGNAVINPTGDVQLKTFSGILQATSGIVSVASGILVTDGDKGDITVSATGSTWTVDNDVITDTKLRNAAALSVIGRSANSVGDPADITAGTDGHILRRSGTTLGFGTIVETGIAPITRLQNATISAGSFTVSSEWITHVLVTAEGGGPTDVLNNILGGVDGQIITLLAVSGDTITLADAAGGTGQVNLLVGSSLLFDVNESVSLYKNGTSWREVNRNILATETLRGVVEIATQAETDTGTNDVNVLTPLKAATRYVPNTRVSTETVQGIIEIATQAETNTGTDDTRALTALKAATKFFSVLNIQSFTTSGTYTPTTGMKYCIVIITGGGGGGGGADVTTSPNDAAAGGGGGAASTVIGFYTAAQIGVSRNIAIGAAGTGGNNTGTDGGDGGSSTFGTLITATGGWGGDGTGTATASANVAQGGVLSFGSTGGLITLGGAPGGWGVGFVVDGTVDVSYAQAGFGGASFWGGGGAPGIIAVPSNATAGLVGGSGSSAYGSGGYGGGVVNQPSGSTASSGVAGICIVIEFG